MTADPARLEGLQGVLRALRMAEAEVAELLFDPHWRMPVAPGWLAWRFLLPLALLGSIAAALLLSPLAWGAAALVLYWLVLPQMRYRERMEEWKRLLPPLQMMLRVCSLLDRQQPSAGQGLRRPRRPGGTDRPRPGALATRRAGACREGIPGLVHAGQRQPLLHA